MAVKPASISQETKARPKVGRGQRRFFGRSSGTGWRSVVVCCVSDGVARAIRARRRRGADGGAVELHTIASSSDGKSPLSSSLSAPIVALLPKSLYLVRILEVPKVEEAETAKMLRLEVGASLPPELGESEMAFRRVTAR